MECKTSVPKSAEDSHTGPTLVPVEVGDREDGQDVLVCDPEKREVTCLVPPAIINGLLCTCSNSISGLFPVVLRRLQTVEKMGPMHMLCVCSFLLVLIFLPHSIRHSEFRLIKDKETARVLIIYGVVVAVCSVTNLYSVRLTAAIYSMLFRLITPYLVALLNRFTLREPLPRAFFWTLFVSVVGGVLVLSKDVMKLQFTDFTMSDVWGILLSLVSATALAGYMILVRKCTQLKLPHNIVFLAQMLSCFVVAFVVSMGSVSQYAVFAQLSGVGWLWYAAYVGIMIFANHVSIWLINRVGSSFQALFLGWRFCATVIFGWIILGEKLTYYLQFVGIALVVAGISLFLVLQQKQQKQLGSAPLPTSFYVVPSPPPTAASNPSKASSASVDPVPVSSIATTISPNTTDRSKILLDGGGKYECLEEDRVEIPYVVEETRNSR